MAPSNPQNRNPIRLGFVPLSDCDPLAVAKQTGLFERYGVDVDLVRLSGWATLPDGTAGVSLTRIYRHDLSRAASELLLPA